MIFRLAPRNLLHDRLRFGATLVGLVFSTSFVTIQLGLYTSSDRMIATLIDRSQADLWIVPFETRSFENGATLPGRERYLALSTQGIAEVLVKVGDRVGAGDLIVRLDDDEARARPAATEAQALLRKRERDGVPTRGAAADLRKAEDPPSMRSRPSPPPGRSSTGSARCAPPRPCWPMPAEASSTSSGGWTTPSGWIKGLDGCRAHFVSDPNIGGGMRRLDAAS
jgi:hypothetical protein